MCVNAKVKITLPKEEIKQRNYPYWAKNSIFDLFLVTGPDRGIAVQAWTNIAPICERVLFPLESGTEITLTVL
jgi:hypothetical protein